MWPFSEISLAAASLIGTIANWVLLASLLGGVLSTFVIVKTADVKEAYWDKDRVESAERVAALIVQGDQLRKDTAEANERAAKAQLDLEKYKAPRTLGSEGAERIAEKMKEYAGSLYDLSVPVNIEEGSDITVAIPFSLDKAGWHGIPIPNAITPMNSLVAPSTGIGTTFGVFGISIGVDDDDLTYQLAKKAKDLVAALNGEGIFAFLDTIGRRPPAAGAQTIPAPKANPIIHVRIGNKP
jgi:hypothetical protein